jgi:hypothetical protein
MNYWKFIINLNYCECSMSRDGAVGLAMSYRLDGRYLIPVRGKNLSLLYSH